MIFVLIISIFFQLITPLDASVPSDPYTYADLFEYAKSDDFGPSVFFKGPKGQCSASRISKKPGEPDFYLTAAHCFREPSIEAVAKAKKRFDDLMKHLNDTIIPTTFEALVKLASPFLEFETEQEKVNYLRVFWPYFEGIRDHKISTMFPKDRDSMDESVNMLMTKSDKFVKTYLPKYRTHAERDLAIFTTCAYGSAEGYPILARNASQLLKSSVTQVAYGTILEPQETIFPRPLQAFDSQIAYFKDDEGALYSAIYLPEKKKGSRILGMTTPGDSGGSLLYKDKKGKWHLIGVVGGFDDYKMLRGLNAPELHVDPKQIYSEYADVIKPNDRQKACKLAADEDKTTGGTPCYGDASYWALLDLTFIEKARKELAKSCKEPVEKIKKISDSEIECA